MLPKIEIVEMSGVFCVLLANATNDPEAPLLVAMESTRAAAVLAANAFLMDALGALFRLPA